MTTMTMRNIIMRICEMEVLHDGEMMMRNV
jgi:hypothetical protein